MAKLVTLWSRREGRDVVLSQFYESTLIQQHSMCSMYSVMLIPMGFQGIQLVVFMVELEISKGILDVVWSH